MALDADNIIIGAAEVSLDGTDVGHTTGGTSFRYEPSFSDIESDQAVGVVRKAKNSEKMFVATQMLEGTLANLKLAMGQPATNLVGSTLTIGYNDSCFIVEHSVILVGPSPSCGTRTITFTKCVSMGTLEYQMQKDNPSQLNLELEVLKTDAGIFGTIVDS